MSIDSKLQIDLNCDLGEGFGNYPSPNDEELLKQVSSANIACGFHAGDPAVMHQTVRAAIKYNVALGAHPGLPDLQGFGRRSMQISPTEAYQMTLYQVGALNAFARSEGQELHHVKPHGALYNMAAVDLKLAEAIVQAVFDFDRSLILYGLAGSKLIEAAITKGLPVAREAFADRTYQPTGLLTSRSLADAMIHEPAQAVIQITRIIKNKSVIATDGSEIDMQADTCCIHGDHEHSVSFAGAIREGLHAAGITVKTITR